MNRKLGYLCFVLAAFLYGSFGLFIRFLQADFNLYQQIFIRSFSALIFTIILVGALLPPGSRKFFKDPRVLSFGLVFPFSMFLWTTAVTMGSIHMSVFGLYTGSLVASPILSKILFKQRIAKKGIYSLLLSAVGVAFFCIGPSEEFSFLALAISFIAGVFQALCLCYRRWLGDINRLVVLLVQGVGGLLLIYLVLIFKGMDAFPNVGMQQYGIGFLFGAFVVLVSYLLLVGSKNLEISKGNVILSTELIWAALLAYLFLDEKIKLQGIVGMICIMTAVTLLIDKLKNSPNLPNS